MFYNGALHREYSRLLKHARSFLCIFFFVVVLILLFSILFHSFNAVHAIISRGSPGTTLLERSAFMRASKYNIGGVLHSLLDVSCYCDEECVVACCCTRLDEPWCCMPFEFYSNGFYRLCFFTFCLFLVETQIEHGILRHASTKPMLFGPLTVNLTFAGKCCFYCFWFLVFCFVFFLRLCLSWRSIR